MSKLETEYLEAFLPFIEYIVKRNEINFYFDDNIRNDPSRAGCVLYNDKYEINTYTYINIYNGFKLVHAITLGHIKTIIQDLSYELKYDLVNCPIKDLVSTIDRLLKMRVFL